MAASSIAAATAGQPAEQILTISPTRGSRSSFRSHDKLKDNAQRRSCLTPGSIGRAEPNGRDCHANGASKFTSSKLTSSKISSRRGGGGAREPGKAMGRARGLRSDACRFPDGEDRPARLRRPADGTGAHALSERTQQHARRPAGRTVHRRFRRRARGRPQQDAGTGRARQHRVPDRPARHRRGARDRRLYPRQADPDADPPRSAAIRWATMRRRNSDTSASR